MCVGTPIERFQKGVVAQVSNEFYVWCVNRRRGENEGHIATGCAKFYGALVAVGSIGLEASEHAFEMLLRNLEMGIAARAVAGHIVEMLFAFVSSAGPEFARRLPPELWARFDVVPSNRVLSSRLNCLLIDVGELRDEFVHGKKRLAAASQPLPPRSEEGIREVRNALEVYREGGQASTADLPVHTFLRAIGDLVLDQTRDFMTVSEYVCDSLAIRRIPPRDIADMLGQIASQYLGNNSESDNPHIWSWFDDLLYLMLLRGLVYPDHVKTVWKAFPRQHEENLVNGMKWFLHDHHYFAQPVKLERFPSDEVREALMIPETIGEPIPADFRISRLISLAIVRAIAARVAISDAPALADFAQWKDYLRFVMEKDRKSFDDEVDFVLAEYGFAFSKDDLVAFCDA
jgi:hypothetical protein